MGSKTNAVTTELLRNAFNAIAQDMSSTLGRSAYSPVIYEMNDFGVALFTVDGEMLGQAPGHPGFIGGLDWGVRAILERFGPDGMRRGDVYLINDSYITGGHLSDVDVITPLFHDETLVGLCSSRAHWLDIGTAEPGFPVNTTEIFQEGIRLGPVRIMHGGAWDEDLLGVLQWNSRLPDVLTGDLNAQIAAGRIAESRYAELVTRFGIPTLRASIDAIFRSSERKIRDFISHIPDGIYIAEGYSDDDYVTQEPIHVRVTVTVDGSDLTIDTTGSSRQAASGINSGYANTVSAARLALLFLHPDPEPEVTHGSFLPLRVVAEPGSIFAAEPPAACMHPHPSMLMLDLVIKALAEAIPERVSAGLPGDSWNVFVMGEHPETRELFISGESLDGGWGASAFADGESAIIHSLGGDFRNMPAETLESRFPIRIRRLALGTDSGGAGRSRGGLNITKEYEVLTNCRLTLHFDRTKTPQWGLFGGKNGATPKVEVYPGLPGHTCSYTKVEQLPLSAGARFTAETGGGGGFGPPFERDPEAVLHDVRCGYVSRAAAEDLYGVVLSDRPLRVNTVRTETMRHKLRAQRAED
jgi:N-methylhydantoinase B